MKYAVLAMIAVYVIALSISPKEAEVTAANHAQEEHSVVGEAQEKQSEVHVTASDAVHEKSGEHNLTAEAAEQKTVENKAPANKWEAIGLSATQNVLALMNEDATLPQPEKEAEPVQENAVDTQKPCPGAVAQNGHDQPVSSKPCPAICPGAEAQKSSAGNQDLDVAMQKLANATNDMVAVTRQLVGATQEMLTASKKVAVEVIDSGKELMENKEAQAAAQAKLVEAVQDVVDATKEAYQATSEALSGAVQTDAPKQ